MSHEAVVDAFFDEQTSTVSYLVADPKTGEAAVIDPVLDFDIRTGKVETRSADAIVAAARAASRRIVAILETHAHADHLSAALHLKALTGAPIAIGERIRDVQRIFKPVFGADDLVPDGRDFDRLLADGDRLPLGSLEIEVLHTPGHTPADVSYRVGDAVFVGDTLFMPDYGTARADFPGGDARQLFRSIRRLLSLPEGTTLYMCHDYKAPARDDYRWETTVAAQRKHNVHVHEGVTEDEFVALRSARDATLKAPNLLLPSIQVNIRAGRFPPAEADGRRYLRIPITQSRMEDRPTV
jgi:glyoxylase-like metal-dependent hydrolase (beta-lactamase superfamily II)